MLIFDEFPNRQAAENFSEATVVAFCVTAQVFDSQGDSNAVDPFPSHLTLER
jgi:hypothetical protein